jgi:aryl-alcohol dehydrogenase-like predicted oxidoreductase
VRRSRISEGLPVGHLGEPADVAHGVLYLGSDESNVVTGPAFISNSGATAAGQVPRLPTRVQVSTEPPSEACSTGPAANASRRSNPWQRGQSTLSLRIVREAIDRGINFLDNCWDYNDGASETRMGNALLDGYRHKALLMTKIDGRSKQEAARQLEESLRRLQTDCIDLVQHHEILRYEDPHRVFAADGAHAALVEARQAGKLRYIGFTGHKDPRIHLYMLEIARDHGFTFDTVQMPLNVINAYYCSFEHLVLAELVQQNIGVLGMKSLAKRAMSWLERGTR